jgi:hypothetical protein
MQYALMEPKRKKRNISVSLDRVPSSPTADKEVKSPMSAKRQRGPSTQVHPGTQVAAKITNQDKSQEWILGVVMRYYADKQRYQIEDSVEDDMTGTKQTHMVWIRNVLPLPHTKPKDEFPMGSYVLALYPATTCFYRCKVIQTPSMNRKIPGHYVVMFDDDNDQQQFVPWDMVVDLPVYNTPKK